MSDLDARLDLAKSLFGGNPSQSTATVKGTVMSDSSSGSVSVKIGEVEYDDDGNIIVPESELIATIPIIGSASTGDEVTVIVEDGSPTAIAAPGWGDTINDKTQHITFVSTGADAGLHIHENPNSYNTDGDLHLTSGGLEIRDSGTVLADFTATDIHLGKNSQNSSIEMCGDTGEINVKNKGGKTYFNVESQYVMLSAPGDSLSTGNGIELDVGVAGHTYVALSGYHHIVPGMGMPIPTILASTDRFMIACSYGLYVNNDPGTSGQVLTSQGSGQPPIWSTPSGSLAPTSRTLATAGTTIPSRTTAYTAVNTTGWNWEEYADGTIHAWGILNVTGVTMELSNSMRRANTTWYLPFPVALSQVDSLQMTNAGGSSLLLSSGFSDGTNSNYCEKWRPVEIGHFSSTASNQTFNLYVELLGRKA